MKRTILSSAIFASALMSGVVSANTVNGGTVNFQGELVSAACAVDINSVNQTVTMGQIRTDSFQTTGDTSGPVPFVIKLTGCDSTLVPSTTPGGTGTQPTVSVAFSGVVDSTTNTALSLTSGAGSASGIGIQITDRTGNLVPLDGSDGPAINIHDGDMTMRFNASYIATSTPVIAGAANSVVSFNLTYQ
ncbi:fimbrial protein [Serratia fonticola]